jgi:hypothetical protein
MSNGEEINKNSSKLTFILTSTIYFDFIDENNSIVSTNGELDYFDILDHYWDIFDH